MTRFASIESILLESDYPEILVARDMVGTAYLALRVERERERYVCIPISSWRLADVRFGRVDLRDAFTQAEVDDAYTGDYVFEEGDHALSLAPLVEAIPERWLPKAGFPLVNFLPAFDEEDDLDLSELAVVKQSSVGVFELRPPESYPEPKIDSYNLVEGVRLFQNLIKHAYNKALSSLKQNDRGQLAVPDGYVLQILPQFTPGSFRVHFQARSANADFFGNTAVGLALSKVDEITQYVDRPDAALDVLRSNQGHLVSAYRALLHFVFTQKTPISYRWSEPGSLRPRLHVISVDAADSLYQMLVARTELQKQEVTHTGVFEKLDTPKWAARTPEGKRLTGLLAEGAENALKSISYEDKLYRIVCEERLDESAAFGKQDTTLYILQPPTLVPTA